MTQTTSILVENTCVMIHRKVNITKCQSMIDYQLLLQPFLKPLDKELIFTFGWLDQPVSYHFPIDEGYKEVVYQSYLRICTAVQQLNPKLYRRYTPNYHSTWLPYWFEHSEANNSLEFRSYISRHTGKAALYITNSTLLGMITTRLDGVNELIASDQPIYVNGYDLHFKQYPLTVAVSKGWNHNHVTDESKESTQLMIQGLLARTDVDVNVAEHRHGWTALHIACMRGDPGELIELLLQRGADKTKRDKQERMPIELCTMRHKEMKEWVLQLTSDKGTISKFNRKCRAYTASVPTEQQRKSNIAIIQELLK